MTLADAFLAHHLAFHPVDASFMGLPGHDSRLPPAHDTALSDERRGLEALERRLAAEPEPQGSGDRLDQAIVQSELALARAALDGRPRTLNPAWYTGEAAFGLIGLLLPQSAPSGPDAVGARLAALPDFLADGRRRLAAAAVPAAWTARARREAAALGRFLAEGLPRHEAWRPDWAGPAATAAAAAAAFADAIAGLPDAPAAAGADRMALILRAAHGLDLTPEAALGQAQAAFDRLGAELAEMAATLTPARSADTLIAELADDHPAATDAVPAAYRHWHDRATAEARPLVTPADDYGLAFTPMAPTFRDAAAELYFLAYRSPPGARPGAGSVYWVAAPGADPAAYLRGQNQAAVKATHAVHHGSIGHHTQNARARHAPSRLGRLGGTDCALGIAFLSAGTMVEGWACHAVDLMGEVPGFYSAREALLVKQMERRNAASVLVDIRLHTGDWSLADAQRFYRDEAGFAPARVEREVVRNSMLPGTRVMYWLGVEAIRGLRQRWRGGSAAFHDTLIGHGHVPIAWAGAEMQRAGLLM